MIEFVTIDGDHVWVDREKIAIVTGAKIKEPDGQPRVLPAVGVAMVVLIGMPPLLVKGSPAEVVSRIEMNDASRSSLFSA